MGYDLRSSAFICGFNYVKLGVAIINHQSMRRAESAELIFATFALSAVIYLIQLENLLQKARILESSA